MSVSLPWDFWQTWWFSVRTEEDVVFREHSVPRRLGSHMPYFSLHHCIWLNANVHGSYSMYICILLPHHDCLHSHGEGEAGCLLSVCWCGLAQVWKCPGRARSSQILVGDGLSRSLLGRGCGEPTIPSAVLMTSFLYLPSIISHFIILYTTTTIIIITIVINVIINIFKATQGHIEKT